MSDGGKGSKQRPTDREKFGSGWDLAFGKPDAESQKAMHTAAMNVFLSGTGTVVIEPDGSIVSVSIRKGEQDAS